MYNTLAKNGTTIAFGLGVAIVAIFLISVFTQIGDRTTIEELVQTNIFDVGLYLTIALAVLCAIAIVLFGVFQVATDLKGSLKGLIGIGILLAIFGIAYSTAGSDVGTPIEDTMTKFDITDGVSKFVGAGIITTLIILGLAVVSLVVSAITNFIK